MTFLAHTVSGSGWVSPIEPWELHPALNHLPIAFLLGGVALDLYAWWRQKPLLVQFANGMLVVGLLTGVLAALAGLLAFFTVPAHTAEAHRLMYWHLGFQTMSLLLFAVPTWRRWRNWFQPPSTSIRLAGCLAALLLLVGSGIGGYIVYHGGAGIEPELLAAAVQEHHHGAGGEHTQASSEKSSGSHDIAHEHAQASAEKAGSQEKSHEHSQASSEKSTASHEKSQQAATEERNDEHAGHAAGSQEIKPQRAPEELPSIPTPDVQAAEVPSGYRVEIVLAGLDYPTSIEFDDSGTMYVAEGGYIYGDDIAPARVLRIGANGHRTIVTDHLNGPVTDLLWHDGRLYISHRGKISVIEAGQLRDIVTGLPSLGDHHNNQLSAGPDGKIYFGQGTATNSGVVGLDNFKTGWLAKYPEVHDVPAKDIRLNSQSFETPDPLSLLAESHDMEVMQDDNQGGEKKSGNAAQQQSEKGHGGHDDNQNSKQQGGHEGHQMKAGETGDKKEQDVKGGATKDNQGQGHEGHQMNAGKDGGMQGHEGHGAQMSGMQMSGGQDQNKEMMRMVKTYAFQPFAKTPPDEGAVRGTMKANGTILRMDPDGSNLEVYAWGFRNPFGILWGPDKKFYAADNGYDERGSRPIAHAPDFLWAVERDAWYGFPDFAGELPVTDAQFRPEKGLPPKLLMRDHPPIQKPLLKLPTHAGAAKLDFSRSDQFGFKGQLFLALFGDMNPITGEHKDRSGFAVVRIDPSEGKMETFFRAKQDARGPKGMEYVVTAGPRRPVDVCFSRDGSSLYVVDIGAMAIISTAAGPTPRPFPGTGVVWRIMPEENARNAASASENNR